MTVKIPSDLMQLLRDPQVESDSEVRSLIKNDSEMSTDAINRQAGDRREILINSKATEQ